MMFRLSDILQHSKMDIEIKLLGIYVVGGILMTKFKRVFFVVMDSVRIGEAPDTDKFNDVGVNTLGHITEKMNGLTMPKMEKLGLGNIADIEGIEKQDNPEAYYTKMQEASNGKDTMTGHWEIMGLNIKQPFRTFPDGFPPELIQDRKSTRLNSSHVAISYAVFCLKKKKDRYESIT